jgi:hypothetical protein
MVLQAWGTYGTLWPVVHQQLGVRPDMGRRRLELMPQVPQGQSRVGGRNVRIAGGSVDVSATHAGRRYTTTARARASLAGLRLGHTLPRGSRVRWVKLDGRKANYRTRLTNRGLEVWVRTTAGRHELVVKAR